jgi:hypothetical protein
LTTGRCSGTIEQCSSIEERSTGSSAGQALWNEEDDMTQDGMTSEMRPLTSAEQFSASREGLSEGRLEFSRGAAHLIVRGARIPELFRARFNRPAPSVSVDGGSVTVRYPRFSPKSWLRPWARQGGQMTLRGDVTWDIRIRYGVAHLDADLRDLRIRSVDLGHGASRIDLRLPRPSGVVPVRVTGGASQVRITRPAGTPARLRIGRGVTDLTFDEQEYGAVGGRLRLASPSGSDTDDRYDIEISGGATHVQVTTE